MNACFYGSIAYTLNTSKPIYASQRLAPLSPGNICLLRIKNKNIFPPFFIIIFRLSLHSPTHTFKNDVMCLNCAT